MAFEKANKKRHLKALPSARSAPLLGSIPPPHGGPPQTIVGAHEKRNDKIHA